MRYLAVCLEKAPDYHHSGLYLAKGPYKHLKRFLPDYELFFVTNGELRMVQAGTEYHVRQGQVLIQSKNETQDGRLGDEVEFYWFHFDGEVLIFESEEEVRVFCEGKEKWIFFAEYFTLPYGERMQLLLSQFNHSHLEPLMDLSRDFLCGTLLAELAFQYEKSTEPVYSEKRFTEILGWVSEHYAENFSMEELAERFEYNGKYLSTLFKRHAGKSLKEFITERRIEVAKRILSVENIPVKQVAYAVGYEDEYYFMRVFKNSTGFTPKNYRKAFCGCTYTN